MMQVAAPLFAAGFTAAVAYACGAVLLGALSVKLAREEGRFIAFVAGSACLSGLVFFLSAIHQARWSVFAGTGAAILALAFLRRSRFQLHGALPRLSRAPAIAFRLAYLAFAVFYFCTALAPEASPDGSAYHLGNVARYLENRGFFRATTLYTGLSQGAEMLFLFAFAFGRHSAAALAHFGFYLALPLGMLAYGKRFGFPYAAAGGALLFFMTPIVGFDGATAYVDVALACVLFALFYLLQIWSEERNPALLIPAGLLAGFAYAIKYTGFVALPYAAGFVAWKMLRGRENPTRAAGVLCACSLVLILPWMAKNWLATGNPLFPFYNAWFPNPYFYIGAEQEYRAFMANWGDLSSKWQIPVEATVRGERLQGVLGPAFLLAPAALFALRRAPGRHLLLAAGVFTLTYPANIGTRFLIPALPFLSLAMALAVAEWRWGLPLLVAWHGYTAWPVNVKRWCDPGAMRIDKFPYKAALRIEKEPDYLNWKLYKYAVGKRVEQFVPRGFPVLCYSAPPQAYTAREMLVSYESALAQRLTDMLNSAKTGEWLPVVRLDFRFPQRPLRGIRLVQTGGSTEPSDYWTANEIRVYGGGREIRRSAHWTVSSRPNPWDAQLALDGNPMTCWRSWQTLAPGMYVDVEFGEDVPVDRVSVLTTPNQQRSQVRLEGWTSAAGPAPLAAQPETSTVEPPRDMRRWIGLEIRRSGIEYVLIDDSDWIAGDVRLHRDEYGFTELFNLKGSRLYRITLDK